MDPHTIPEEARGERLDRYLVRIIPEKSRSVLQREILEGRIRLNEKNVAPHHFLKGGEVISFQPEKKVPMSTPAAFNEVAILFQDDDVAVIEKPPGLLVHPAHGSNERTLVDWLAANIPETKSVGNPARPGIVHRLDRDVSGVLAVAKSVAGYEELTQAFRERRVEKKYVAIVSGIVEKDEGIITFPIRRARKGGRMAAIPHSSQPWHFVARLIGARNAETRFTVVKRLTHATLVDVTLITGRSHQIRVHFFAFGHPVLGDPLYPAKEKPKILLERIYLHAASLAFPLHGTMRGPFVSPLPDAFERLMASIRPGAHPPRL